MERWTDPAWLAGAHAWIRDRLSDVDVAQAGEIDQSHIRPWSTAMRVPTTHGDLWFKANAPVLAYEAAVVQVLVQACPDLVPELLAVQPDLGWMLMRDGGERLREVVDRERGLERWIDVLPLYAELQIAAERHAEELVAGGAPDLRLSALPRAYVRLVEETDGLTAEDRDRLTDRVADVDEMCRALAGSGIPATIQHNDLHDGQVFVADGRYRVFDWGDSCVSHPFTTMAVTLEGVLSWGLDDVAGSVDTTRFRNAYLWPFAARTESEELETALRIALRLGWICRAATTRPLALALDGEPREKLLDRVRVYLRMFLDPTSA